ncbi:hypothetical protein BAE44_0019598 [Dichanthelium oligosanthes]|uniref:KIB1-4 beta-propeller domain-containing protein n=1 Tax=Dichanthelium oligosanthes TaxID=888268 RepID=A0A1E5V2J5_9POAL|nr:hypothetical protein BAE44_0019598 [Dichanthelium oligosanthes]
MAGWSSLPGDLINCVADVLLATDDLDYYMDLRAVCHSWRSSTADPKSSPRDPRFLPRQLVMLDEVHQSDARLFVNAATGRFVRKDLPLLRSASRGGVAAHVIGSSPPTLVLVCDESGKIYWADPDSKSFIEFKEECYAHPPIRSALVGGIYAAAREGGSLASLLVPVANKILAVASKPFADYFSSTEGQAENRCFLVESAGEVLLVFKLHQRIEVFKIDTGSNVLETVKDIGSRALFIEDCKCLSVDAEKFPSVEANCIYYVVEEPWYDVCVYSLKDETEAWAGGAIDSFNPITLSPKVSPPFTVVQLLCSYTFEVRVSGLQWEKLYDALVGVDRELVAHRNEEFFANDCESEDDYY